MRTFQTALLATACALALSACGDKTPPPAEAAAPAPAAVEAAAPVQEPAAPVAEAAPAVAAAADAKGAAIVTDCATTIESNDAMQYNVSSIGVPATCAQFTINLKHVGQMPVAAMGHNIVISAMSDMQSITSEGMGAGVANSYVKEGDARVIAHTKLIGGGESTSVTFDTSKIKGAGPFEFFCTFPGHSALMKGTISIS